MSIIIMRHAVLMEDEGRHHFIKKMQTREEAEDWIKAQKDEYFKPQDYYIAESNRYDSF